ncbi:rac GTPase-activating protein 1 [Trichonephila inaurata madagascariensis]|uniref:Rac GTPase-activating protein 1 n=1 Tax=Trichonephila inaurata madagascariensis TaxID=2747483 RepID=A0A8X6XR09_9ARAC|nr:rac GTPase-activating protein 1 [Trichonephila inaurata madagascariensis]
MCKLCESPNNIPLSFKYCYSTYLNMEFQDKPRMSLTAQYDDLCRYGTVLTTGCEEEFIYFVKNQVNLMHKMKKTEEIQILKEQNNILETEKRKHDCQMRHMKNLLESEVKKRRKIETEKTFLEKKMSLIQKILLNDDSKIDCQIKEKLFSLSNSDSDIQMEMRTDILPMVDDTIGSLLSSSDIDNTVADERHSNCNVINRQKQLFETATEESGDSIHIKRNLKENSTFDVKESELDIQMIIHDTSEIKESKTPCSSELNLMWEISEIKDCKSDNNNESTSVQLPDVMLESGSESIQSCGQMHQSRKTKTNLSSTPKDEGNSEGRIHSFVSRPVIRAEKCYVCCKPIQFCKQNSKCSTCRMTCHPDCKERCPLPCVPTTSSRNSTGTIADYASSASPKIPSVIVCCINEIESRGFKDIGLYRKSGNGRDVRDLKEKLLKGILLDNLDKIDVHVICGAMKEFFRSLKDSLITRSAWKIFVKAANQSDENISLKLLYDAVCRLPQSNKATLAFLLLHLQKVAESTKCKMPCENLARVFGPTIVGYSTHNPPNSSLLLETGQQCLVMQKLLKISSDLWQNLLKDDKTKILDTSQEKNLSVSKVPVMSRLRPLYSSFRKRRSSPKKKFNSPRSSRNTKEGRKKGKKF